MSVQGEINQALGVAAKAAAIGKGFSMAEQQKQDKESKEKGKEAKEKKIQDRQELLFLEQSQNKIEAQRMAIAGIDKKLPELEGSIDKLKRASRYKRSGKEAMAEARASLADALDQKKTLIADRTARYTLLKQREQMMANARKEFNYGEE